MRKASAILLERWGMDPDGLGKSIDKGLQAVQAHRTIELPKQSKPTGPKMKGKGWKMIFGKWRKLGKVSGSPMARVHDDIGPIHMRMNALVEGRANNNEDDDHVIVKAVLTASPEVQTALNAVTKAVASMQNIESVLLKSVSKHLQECRKLLEMSNSALTHAAQSHAKAAQMP